MIRDKSVYEPPEPEQDGLRLLIMHYWPRGIRRTAVDLWLKEASPSTELLHAYQHEGLSWSEFAKRYRNEMRRHPDVLARLRDLEHEHGTITLMCYERIPPHEHCHRRVLRDLLLSAR